MKKQQQYDKSNSRFVKSHELKSSAIASSYSEALSKKVFVSYERVDAAEDFMGYE